MFNINIVKLLDKFPKLMESSLTLDFLKNYFKDIKDRCNKRQNEFKQVKIICLRERMLQNGQTDFKDFTANVARFLKRVSPLYIKG